MEWTADEDDRLLDLWLSGYGHAEVSEGLPGRTDRAVVTRLWKLCSRYPAGGVYRGPHVFWRAGLPLTDADRSVLSAACEDRGLARGAHLAENVAPLLRRTVEETDRIMDAVAASAADQRAGFGVGNSGAALLRARRVRVALGNRYGFEG